MLAVRRITNRFMYSGIQDIWSVGNETMLLQKACKTQADVGLMFYFRPRPMIWLHEVTRSEFARLKPNEAVVSTKNQKREVDLLYEAEER